MPCRRCVCKAGDALTLSDGKGLRLRATMVDPEQGTAEVVEFGRAPQPVVRLNLIQALAKNGHDEQAIDMATQIGVDTVIPWQADRSIAKWKAGRTDRKWRQVLEAATEQSRRCWTPELGDCVSSKGIVAICRRACVHGELVIVPASGCHAPAGMISRSRSPRLSDRCLDDGRTRAITVVVGPEGGISEAEVDAFVGAGAECCVLGTNILRASAAGPVALALLSRAVGRYA